MRPNPTDATYATARRVVVTWLDHHIDPDVLVAIDSDAAARLVDDVAWAIQVAIERQTVALEWLREWQTLTWAEYRARRAATESPCADYVDEEFRRLIDAALGAS